MRRFTLLMTGENTGLVGKYGDDFHKNPEHYDRLNVVEETAMVSAAPELYEALIALRHEMMESGNYHAEDFGWPEAKRLVESALAKATEGEG